MENLHYAYANTRGTSMLYEKHISAVDRRLGRITCMISVVSIS